MGRTNRLDRIDINILASAAQQSGDQRRTRRGRWAFAEIVPDSREAAGKGGFHTGYGARLNLGKLTDFVTVFTRVTLGDHRRKDFAKFEVEIRQSEAVQECHLASGGYDYLLNMMTRSIAAYQEIMERIAERGAGRSGIFHRRDEHIARRHVRCG